MGGLPVRYPIVHPFLPGRPEQLCAESSLFSHTLEVLGAFLPLISHIIPGLEPRASSQLNVRTSGDSTYSQRVYREWWYTQGV